LTLTASAAPDVPRALAVDATRARQVLLNLLGNAIKFTQTGSVNVVLATGRCASGAAGVVFSVVDTGIGIAPDALDRLFERFSQADESIARRFGGTGLGLAISRELARLMDGDLSVESVEGVGSTFRFAIPLGALVPLAPEASQAPIVPAASISLDLLVAEDNEVNRLVVGEMLARMGHRHEFVSNGVQAIARASAKRFDAILMDAQMPEMDGDEATRQIRLLPAPFGQVPIVALTANAMSGDREMYLAAGMNDYVSKPVRAAELAAALVRATRPQAWA
jgi:CheY-like chemotaxis protein